MKKLRNRNNENEKLMVDISGRKAVLKKDGSTTNYTAFIEFDKTVNYDKILKIILV